MLLGAAVGALAGVAMMLAVSARIRPDLVLALVLGVPSVAGLVALFASSRRAVTTIGAFLLAIGPGWFATLAVIEAVTRG